MEAEVLNDTRRPSGRGQYLCRDTQQQILYHKLILLYHKRVDRMSTPTSSEEEIDEDVPEDLDELAEDVLDGEFVTFEEHNARRD